MPSLKLDKLMARLYARAGNANLTLNRKDLEVINELIISEVTRYETEISTLTRHLDNAVRTIAGLVVSPSGSTAGPSKTGPTSPQGSTAGPTSS